MIAQICLIKLTVCNNKMDQIMKFYKNQIFGFYHRKTEINILAKKLKKKI